MKPVRSLVTVIHGSKLYGTNTPSSDDDFKGVHLPSGSAIVMQRAKNVLDTSIVVKGPDGKNRPESIDQQSYSLQKFFEMLAKGDTAATEILFAPDWAIVDRDPLWGQVQQAGIQCALNRKMKGFVDYCQSQAAKYGIKGSRMAAVRKLLDQLETWSASSPNDRKLSWYGERLKEFAETTEHCEWVNIPHPSGAEAWHIKCCDRAMPLTAHLVEVIKVYQAVWNNYGVRARQAMTNEGIDWKAVSHAYRVAEQAEELLKTGSLTFPRENSALLTDIKLGRIPYDQVSFLREAKIAKLNELEPHSALPESSDHRSLDRYVESLYRTQVM